MFDNTDAQLAALVHPKFKLDWIDSHIQRTDVLTRRVSALATPSGDSEMSSAAAIDNENSSQSQAPDFFVPTGHKEGS